MTTEDQTPATEAAVDHKAAVAAAEQALTDRKAEQTAATAAAKEATTNHKAAVAYNKSMADDAEGKAEAVSTEQGWAAEVTRTKGVVEAAKAAVATAKEDVKAAKAAAKAAGKPAKEPKAKVERVEQNGVKKPLPGSRCGLAWDLFDELTASLGRPATIADAVPLAEPRGLNPGNVRAEYGFWRKFNGIPAQPRAKKEPAAPAPAPAEAPAAE